MLTRIAGLGWINAENTFLKTYLTTVPKPETYSFTYMNETIH